MQILVKNEIIEKQKLDIQFSFTLLKVTNKDTGYCFTVFVFDFEQVLIHRIDSQKSLVLRLI